jgi:hypothetical protein
MGKMKHSFCSGSLIVFFMIYTARTGACPAGTITFNTAGVCINVLTVDSLSVADVLVSSMTMQTLSLTDLVLAGPLNIIGNNTALGNNALAADTSGANNTAVGYETLMLNTTGSDNVALGSNALDANISGNNNTACGYNTLPACTTGSNNIAVGSSAGSTLATGSNNIYIGAPASSTSESNAIHIGTVGTQTTCYLQGLAGLTLSLSGVVVNSSTGQLGYLLSSEEFKKDIADMGETSSDVLKLRPVIFVYKNDDTNTQQWGLIAEEVDKIFPTLVVRDANDKPHTVQYHILPVLLLNELQKQYHRINKQDENIDELRATIDRLARAIYSVRKQLEEYTG